MSNIATNDAGFAAPSRIKAVYWSTYLHIPSGKTYRQMDTNGGNDWVEIGTGNGSTGSMQDIKSVLDIGNQLAVGQTIDNVNSTAKLDFTAPGAVYTLTGAGVGGAGSIPAGFWYKLDGFDYSPFIPIGSTLVVTGTNGGVNDGVFTLTTSVYDGASNATYFQWDGMTTVVGAPFGNMGIHTTGDWAIGNDETVLKGLGYNSGTPIMSLESVTDLAFNNREGFILSSVFNYIFLGSYFQTDPIPANNRAGGIVLVNNRQFTSLTGGFGASQDSFPIFISNQQGQAVAGVVNSVAAGGKYVRMKTDGACYSNRFIFNVGALSPFETRMEVVSPTADREIKFPNADMDFDAALSETLTFGGGGSGDVATLTVTNGIITGKTLVP